MGRKGSEQRNTIICILDVFHIEHNLLIYNSNIHELKNIAKVYAVSKSNSIFF